MRRNRRFRARKPSHDRWLVSYADFITLLFAFFVVMYSAAQLDKRRAGQLATAIQAAFLQRGSLPSNPTASDMRGTSKSNLTANDEEDQSALKGEIEHMLAGEISNGNIAVRRSAEGLVISLREIGFFDTGSDEIKASSAPAFARLAAILRRSPNEIRIEGHTDNVPINNSRFFSNWDLSTARATRTIRLLILYGVTPERLAASGYAEYHPIASNTTPEGRAMNRRVDVVVLRKRSET